MKRNRRRYYLHYRIRKQGFQVYTRLNTVAIPVDTEPSAHMLELRDKFHYNLQLTLV